VNSELVLMDTHFDSTRLHVEDHVHVSRVLRALHLIRTEFDETPIKEVADGPNLCIFEAAISDVSGLDAFFVPCDRCDVVSVI
jgi:hypothetical protein